MSRIRAGDRIFRYEVPVDGAWHELAVAGDVLYVDGRRFGFVEFWARSPGTDPAPLRRFYVLGTGHVTGEESTYLGTVVQGDLVWHLVELGPAAHPLPEVA